MSKKSRYLCLAHYAQRDGHIVNFAGWQGPLYDTWAVAQIGWIRYYRPDVYEKLEQARREFLNDMTKPVRNFLDYKAIARQIFVVEPL